MNWLFYGIWSIICLILSIWIVFICGWEEEKIKCNLLLSEYSVPTIYESYSKKNNKYRKLLFFLGGLTYTLAAFVLHFFCYGVQNIDSITDWITRSMPYIIILVGLISQTSINNIGELNSSNGNTNTTNNKHNEIANTIQKIIMSVRKFFFERIIKREKKTYNEFIAVQISRVSKNVHLQNLFILKCKSSSWSKTLGISIEQYEENIASRLWDAFIDDVRFNEVTEEIFTKEFEKFNANIIDIIRLFHNCNEEQIKGKEEKNQCKIDELRAKHDDIKKKYSEGIVNMLTEVDINSYSEIDCSLEGITAEA